MKSGFVAVVGKPNVGKSTLLNRLVGQKLAITSPKPQSTRDRITGILTFDDTQIVLVDTPGLIEPNVALQHVMRGTALQALRDADVILHLIDAGDPRLHQWVPGLRLKHVVVALELVGQETECVAENLDRSLEEVEEEGEPLQDALGLGQFGEEIAERLADLRQLPAQLLSVFHRNR